MKAGIIDEQSSNSTDVESNGMEKDPDLLHVTIAWLWNSNTKEEESEGFVDEWLKQMNVFLCNIDN